MEVFYNITICISIFAGHNTTCCKKPQSCAPEDGQKFAPKHVELIFEINKLLLLHLVGFYITLPTVHITFVALWHCDSYKILGIQP